MPAGEESRSSTVNRFLRVVTRRRVGTLLYIAILLLFFLPWITVECQGDRVDATGFQLAFEKQSMQSTPSTPGDSFSGEWNVGREPLVALAFILSLVGVLLGLVPRSERVPPQAIFAAVSMVGLWLTAAFDGLGSGPGSPDDIDYHPGAWLAFALFGAVFLLEVVPWGAFARARSRAPPRASKRDGGELGA